MNVRLWVAVSCLVALGCVACGDHVQLAEPPERQAASNGSATSGPQSIPMHGTPPSEGGSTQTATALDPSIQDPIFAGQIVKGEGLELPAKFTLYVIAGRVPNGSPQVFTHRYENPTLPLDFELGRGDMPFGDQGGGEPQALYLILSEAGTIGATEGLYFRTAVSPATQPGTRDLKIVLTPGS